MRKQIVAGNWKMNKNLQQGKELCNSILNLFNTSHKEVIIAVPYTHFTVMAELLKGSDIKLAAQNCHHELSGAYTGEISAYMFANIGVDYVILGHSERRAYNNEGNDLLRKKVDTALSQNLKVIYCCGETLEERYSEVHFDLVAKQIIEGVFHLNAESMKNIVIAYEPVWAIGTGETATSGQAQEMHAHIRNVISNQYGADVAHDISILYGGSCKANNAQELFAQTDVDGGLIGGASLVAEDFISIINA